MEEGKDVKIQLQRSRAELRLNMLAGFKNVPHVDIPEIPIHRSKFPNSKNDFWVRLDPEEKHKMSSCLYTLDSEGVFGTHRHLHNSETVSILTPGAKVEWVTESGIFFYEYPARFEVSKGIKHALVNLVPFPIEIRVDWCPLMEGFKAEF